MAPTLAYYASTDPQALWQAGGATALFIAGFGAAGYATRRDLSALARVLFWALVALIVFGIVLIFVHIPDGALIYSVLGLVIFAGFTMFDFQRLRPLHGPRLRAAPGRVDLPRVRTTDGAAAHTASARVGRRHRRHRHRCGGGVATDDDTHVLRARAAAGRRPGARNHRQVRGHAAARRPERP